MPYKVGKKTKTNGWPILKKEGSNWKVIAHSDTKEKAEASIRARYRAAMPSPYKPMLATFKRETI